MSGLVSSLTDIERVQAALPFLDIDEDQLEKRPALTSLLLQLGSSVSSNTGALKNSEAEYDSVCSKLEREFGSYVQERVLHDVLENMLVEWSAPDSTDNARNDESTQMLAALDECLSLYELAALFRESAPLDQCLSANADAESVCLPNVFGRQHVTDVSPQLLRLPDAVEHRLRQLTSCLLQQTSELVPAVSGVCAVSDLESVVAEAGGFRARANSAIEQLLLSDRCAKLQQLALLVQQYESSQLKLITGPLLKSESESRDVDTDYIAANLRALELKARVTELQIRSSTYGDRVVQAALQTAGSRLRARSLQLESRLEAGRQQLQLYHEAGEELQQLVGEYQRLTRQLTQKRWLLREMETMEAPNQKLH